MGHAATGPIVLIVDDEVNIRRIFSTHLRLAGYTSVEAQSGEGAWSSLEDGLLPQAILLDLLMPGMGGLAFLLKLRADPRFASIPVTIVTGHYFIDPESRADVDRLNAALRYKPLYPEEIVVVVAMMVQSATRRTPSI
jgi:CheY-like chemotaxis protein